MTQPPSEGRDASERLSSIMGIHPPEPPVTPPASPLASAFDPGRPGLRAVAIVAVLVILGAAAAAWFSRPRAEPVAPLPTAVPAAGTGSAVIVVAVSGKVRFPGLVRLPAGARVADAVEAAGGVLPGVDVSGLNLARKLVDGELVTVGVAAPDGSGPGGGAGKVSLNTATVAQLDALPGVGPVLAERIVAYRDRKGGFRSIGELRQVEGIGDAKFEQLKDLVTL